MKNTLFLLQFFFISHISFSFSLPLEINTHGKIQNFNWNTITPLSLKLNQGQFIDLFVILPDKTKIPLTKKITNDLENIDHYIYYLESPELLANVHQFQIQAYNAQKTWPFQHQKISIKKQVDTPNLKLISASETVAHGGAGIMVIESEKKQNLSLLAFIDEKNIPFYPQTFITNGFYVILFPWYTDYSEKWTNQFVIAMDKSGNTNILSLDKITAKKTKYRQSTINLPPDYAKQKAKETGLSDEEAKKLEGNIKEINSLLAQQKTFERWKETRTSFKENIKKYISSSSIFSTPSVPMKNAITTATYGDRRKYYYQKKLVRTSIHRGLDYASYKNTPIYALLDGTVIYADWYGGNGKSVILNHGLNVYSMYAHNSELLVKPGQKVKSGTQISVSGTTGQSTGDHLHLSLIVQGIFMEPKEWITEDSIYQKFHKPLQIAEKYIINKEKQ